MDLVRAVLQLKNEISLLPPEGYILVVKVGRAGRGHHQHFYREAEAGPTKHPSQEGLAYIGGNISNMSLGP